MWIWAQWPILTFFYPFAGLGRAIGLLVNHVQYGHDKLGKALAVGVVVVVGRSKNWQPRTRREGEEGELVYMELPDGFTEAMADSEM